MTDEGQSHPLTAVEVLKTLPNFDIERCRYLLTLPRDVGIDRARQKSLLLDFITKFEMFPYYKWIRETYGLLEDVETLEFQAHLEGLRAKNEQKIKELSEREEYARDNFGATEVKDILVEKANYYLAIGDKDLAVKEYELALSKTVGANSKLEIVLVIIRIAFFFNDLKLLTQYIERAKQDIKEGGDWEMRNRLNIYEGVYLIICRKFKEAAELLVKALPTFTATELITLEELVQYCITLALVTLDRATIKKSILESSEVSQVATSGSTIFDFINNFYNCNYKNFMMHLVKITEVVMRDRNIGRHWKYYLRQARLPAYKQFLLPYKSVTLQRMAEAFQVSPEFIEKDLVSYISGMRLECKIDRVNGVIENNVSDERNNHYVQTIKQGDLLINRIQKISRIIDM